MSENAEVFVDPNSGAAPQPGSWAGEEAAAKGFGPPPVNVSGESVLEEEVVPSAYEPPGAQAVPESVSASYPALASDEQVEESGEAEAVASKELETEATTAGAGEVEDTDPDGTHPSVLPVEDGVTPPDQPADGDGEPVDAPVGGDGGQAGEEAQAEAVSGEANLDSGEPEEQDYSELLDKTVPDVVEYLEQHPEERDAVVAAEQKRENPRKGVLEA